MRYPGIVLIALVFCLVCLVPAPVRAQTAPAGNQQEPMRAEGTAGNLKGLTAPLPLTKPVAVVCVLPGGKNPKPSERRIKLAPGQKPLAACPPGATTYIYLGSSPGRFPSVAAPPPADAAAIETQLNKDAQTQLDAIAAAKLRNKTPARQTPEQKASGQPP